MGKKFSVTDSLHIFQINAPWTYIPIPKSSVPNVKPGGWGSIPVIAVVGSSTWRTSLFPIKKNNYFIPIKKSIRDKEAISVGDTITVEYRTI